jgi:hypothetical protein
LGGSLVFAHRTGAATNFGDYDIYFANTLGRSENLRGFWRYRFSGKNKFLSEYRIKIGFIKRKNFGMLGFFDDGRVWIDDEDSKNIHMGYGGGLYFIPFNALGINLSYGRSKE